MIKFILPVCCLIMATAAYSMPINIFVSPHGDDKFDGMEQKPVKTLQRALDIARTKSENIDVNIILNDGIYRLDETVVISPNDSKKYPAALHITARHNGKAILSGGERLKCQWEKADKPGVYFTYLDDTRDIDQLYVNGKRQNMARFPNTSPENDKNVFDTWKLLPKGEKIPYDKTLDPLSPERIATWDNPKGAYLHAMQAYLWGDMHWIVKEKDSDSTLVLEGGWQNNRPTKMHSVYRMIENVKEELDAPEEWFYDRAEKKLYYIPPEDMDLNKAEIEIVRLRHLIEFNGTMQKPVTGITLNGIEFRQTARTFMDNREPLLRSDWTTYRGGAVMMTGTEDCSIVDCDFNQVGGNAILISDFNRRVEIKQCHIHESGANGIVFVGNPECVRSPSFRYGPQDYDKMDYTAGPKCEDYPSDCIVDDCLITMTGRFEKQTAPIQISMSSRITIKYCSIYKVPRAGININEGTFGGHVIENCDIFDTVLETSDHGSFNSWGRDRYWSPDVNLFNSKVKENPALPYLDMNEANIIRHNRWRCDHGWDIDLDDGSSQYIIYDNLLLSGGLKMREGYNRTAINNIIINNSLHPHVWPSDNGDIFTRNIVFTAYRPASMGRDIPENGKWGAMLDYNLFCSSIDDMKLFSDNETDNHSLAGDPMFIDPKNGDFRVADNSPALKIGFRNFDTMNFGVRSPRLRKIALSPIIPELNKTTFTPRKKTEPISIAGITVQQITGEELSAYGVDFNMTGFAIIDIQNQSLWEKSGLKKGDLILSFNSHGITTTEDFIRETNSINTGTVITIVRDQQSSSIKLQK